MMTRATTRAQPAPPPAQEGGAAPQQQQKPQAGPARRATRSSHQHQQQQVAAAAAAAAPAQPSPDPTDQLEHEAAEAGSVVAALTPNRRGAPNQDPALSVAPSSVASRRSADEQPRLPAHPHPQPPPRLHLHSPAHPPHPHKEQPEQARGSSPAEALVREEDARRINKHYHLTKLAVAADELLESLAKPDPANAVFAGRLQVQRDIFLAVRQIYLADAALRPFADWQWLHELEGQTPESVRIATAIIVFANVASALDWTERVLAASADPDADAADGDDVLAVLEPLDDAFPSLFTLPGRDGAHFNELALDIRTARWIETLARSPVHDDAVDPREVAARVFCEPAGSLAGFSVDDWTRLFAKGPYRRIGNLRGQALTDVCASQAARAFSFLPPAGSSSGARDPSTLAALRDAFPLHTLLLTLREWLLRIYSSAHLLLEKAPGQLMALHVQQDQSLFRSRSDIMRMMEETASAAPGADAYPDHDLVSSDVFETDSRFDPAPKRRRPAHPTSSAVSGLKRPRHLDAVPDMAHIQRQKEQALKELRAKSSSSPKPRYIWSQHDTSRLIKCIDVRDAQWANIEKHDQQLFEIPRNQQAYRDKARNLKVDFLIADAPLPPKFDKVALGKKEIERLHKCNKNPFRREADVDDDGVPVNTAVTAAALPEGGGGGEEEDMGGAGEMHEMRGNVPEADMGGVPEPLPLPQLLPRVEVEVVPEPVPEDAAPSQA